MTPEEADKEQQWLGMDGATAWHLIDRHAEDWGDIAAMMEAWKRAHVLAEREACAKVCDARAKRLNDGNWAAEEWDTICNANELAADAIRARSNK